MTSPMCENCINFREHDELDLVDDFQREHFDGFCFSKNKEHGKGKPHSKGDWCIDFSQKCDQTKCHYLSGARWEVNFCVTEESSYVGGTDFIAFFCDKHFVELNGCGNAMYFRFIGKNKWIDFTKHDNIIVLKEFVKKSHKKPINFKLINEFC